jgi:UrcA family protein
MTTTSTDRLFAAARSAALGTAAALLALSAQAGTGAATTAMQPDQVVVGYADLNLATTEGNQRLYARLSAAAREACGGDAGRQSLGALKRYAECYNTALDNAVRKVDSPRLQALHTERTTPRAVG